LLEAFHKSAKNKLSTLVMWIYKIDKSPPFFIQTLQCLVPLNKLEAIYSSNSKKLFCMSVHTILSLKRSTVNQINNG